MIDGQEIFKCCDNCKYYQPDHITTPGIYCVCCNPDSDNYDQYPAASDGCVEWEGAFYDD